MVSLEEKLEKLSVVKKEGFENFKKDLYSLALEDARVETGYKLPYGDSKLMATTNKLYAEHINFWYDKYC